jgi:hypothetical protein
MVYSDSLLRGWPRFAASHEAREDRTNIIEVRIGMILECVITNEV